ncbi:hypothetical protein M2413_000707 [Pseudomonas putida]|nr:hypothetical protein [Pseudomonas putida]
MKLIPELIRILESHAQPETREQTSLGMVIDTEQRIITIAGTSLTFNLEESILVKESGEHSEWVSI